MKALTLFFTILPTLISAQVIDTTLKDFVVFKNGTKQEIEITDDDRNTVHVVVNGKANKIQKDALQSWYNGNIWEQPFKYNEEGLIEYSEVIQVPEVSKDELYNRGRRLYATTFGDSKEVLEMDDREAGNLIGTGWVKLPFSKPLGIEDYAEFWLTLEIQVKDGRYKYTISDLRIKHPYDPSLGSYQNNNMREAEEYFPTDNKYSLKMDKQLKAGVLISTQAIVDEIKKSMSNQGKTKDW